jgi:hypothetical protein
MQPVWQTTDPDARLDTDPPEPVAATFADAQAATNFVVLEPTDLPGDCSVAEATYRPEQPPGRPDGVDADDIGQTPHSDGNPSSVRAVVEGDGRRLRLKQFLYDWAPPAASVAPLWRTPEPEPFHSRSEVAWLGTDYKDNRGACVQRARTQLELSVTAGEFSDDELRAVVDGLVPAAPDAAATSAVERTPFHRLNYWARYQAAPPAVPNALADYAPNRPYEDSYELSRASLATNPPVPALVPGGDRFLFDSALAFRGADALECVFRHRENASDHLWLTAAGSDSPLAPDLPPEPSDQQAATRDPFPLRDTTVHYAALTEDNGAWEAFWTEGGVRYALVAGASQFLDGEAFREVVASLRAP